jgi:phosphoglycerate dehydrogenase-like enzyme
MLWCVGDNPAPIVDEDALYAALKDGHLGGAALDVWWQYPSRTVDRLTAHSMNCPMC